MKVKYIKKYRYVIPKVISDKYNLKKNPLEKLYRVYNKQLKKLIIVSEIKFCNLLLIYEFVKFNKYKLYKKIILLFFYFYIWYEVFYFFYLKKYNFTIIYSIL